MMQALRKETVTPEAYLAWEREQPYKNEYLDGLIYAMAGGTVAHGDTAMNICLALKVRLQGGPSRPHNSDVQVRIEKANAYFYPDVSVSCDPADAVAVQAIGAPTLIVEVLSPSTAAFDRGDKFAAYRTLLSLQDYILVDPETKRVERFSRNADGTWQMTDVTGTQTLHIPSLETEIPLAAIFENVA
jgi:Uma2 family endonuclease